MKNGLSRRHLAISIVMVRSYGRRSSERHNKAQEWPRWLSKPVVNTNPHQQMRLRFQRKTNSQLKPFKNLGLKNVSSMTGGIKRKLS